ncbi:MAG: cupredoxin domain-containing protein [Acidimicrobiia bacterium]
MRLPRTLLAAVAGVALVATACGDDDASTAGQPDATRTVVVDMVDIAFGPETLEIDAGETVRFVFTNRGEVVHDAFIGDADAQAGHETEMRDAEDAEEHGGGHGEDEGTDAVTVEPGESEELTHTFEEAGAIEVGCHQPGHYEAGMKIAVEVA